MAFTASSVWECWQTGADSNGGGFDPGVAGFATDGAATSANTSAPVFTTASYNFVAGDVGAWLYIKSGTNWTPGWYQIASVASNAATLDAAIGHAVLAAGTPSTVVGCATVASPTTGTWGVDYSQRVSAQITFTDMVIGTSTKFTSAANPVGKNMIGNVINVTSGTGFTVQRVAIVSTVTITATCDKSLGTGGSTGGNGKLGGAFASPALPFSVAIASNTVWIKTGAYTITSASSNVANGVISASVALRLEGYGTVRGDLLTPPTLTASGITAVAIVTSSASSTVRNLTIDGASLTSITGFSFTGVTLGYLLTAKNCTSNGFSANTSSFALLIRCIATGCSVQVAFNYGQCIACEAYNNTFTGFGVGDYCSLYGCLSYNNSGATSDGIGGGPLACYIVGCVAYNNGRDGIRLSANSTAVNCLAEGNAGVGVNSNGANDAILNCAAYNNGTNYVLTGARLLALNNLTGTASFFVNAAAANFALNSTAGGGAIARAAGLLGVTPDGLSTGYQDIGALQSAAAAAAGGISAARAFGGF